MTESVSQQKEQVVSKDMLIGELVQAFPHATDILLKHGVHCVGCGGAYMETLQEGLMGHGMSEEEVDKVVDQINEAAPVVLGDECLQVTDKAVEKIKGFLEQESDVDGLRLAAHPGGCSGFQ